MRRSEQGNSVGKRGTVSWNGHGSQCLCVVGVPGSGKSTIAASIAGDLLGIRQSDPSTFIVHYFVRRGVDTTINYNTIFPTLALKLAHLRPSFAKLLREKIPDVSIGVLNSLQTCDKALLLDPITKIPHEKFLVVIDALDEVSQLEKLARILSRIIGELPPNIRLILTTRPEDRILRNLGPQLVDKISLEIAPRNHSQM